MIRRCLLASCGDLQEHAAKDWDLQKILEMNLDIGDED